MDIFHQSFLIQDYENFDNFVFSLKVLQPLMATAGVCELCSFLAIFVFSFLGGFHLWVVCIWSCFFDEVCIVISNLSIIPLRHRQSACYIIFFFDL